MHALLGSFISRITELADILQFNFVSKLGAICYLKYVLTTPVTYHNSIVFVCKLHIMVRMVPTYFPILI